MMKRNEYFPQSFPHPGEILAEKLHEMRMGPKEFAVRTAKPEQTINAVLKGRSAITPDMAVQFESVTKIPAHFWMNSQRSYDEYKARQKYLEIIQSAITWARNFPTNEMAKLNWIRGSRKANEKAVQLLDFFGISNHKAWEDYYLKGELKVEFRISLASIHNQHAISAWLRQAEVQAKSISAKSYSDKVFKAKLPVIKKIMTEHPEGFYQKLRNVCLEAGVKVVYVPCLPKAPINGATRWINDHPVIQLSGRHKRNDIFWFTFFHEAGHILKHGKKEIFLENIEYSDKDDRKEQEANDFAVEWTLSEAQEVEICSIPSISESHVLYYARKFETHPAIIVGRLQRRGIIKNYEGNRFFEKINLDQE